MARRRPASCGGGRERTGLEVVERSSKAGFLREILQTEGTGEIGW